jgi:hypothetical protein
MNDRDKLIHQTLFWDKVAHEKFFTHPIKIDRLYELLKKTQKSWITDVDMDEYMRIYFCSDVHMTVPFICFKSKEGKWGEAIDIQKHIGNDDVVLFHPMESTYL